MTTPFKDRIKVKLGKYLTYVLVILLVMFALSLFRNVSRIKLTNQKITEKKEKVEKLIKENEEIAKKLETVDKAEFVEKKLRDDLGLAKEGEIVVILPSEEILRSLAPDYDEEEDTLPDPNWKKWINLFM
ncbi:septum formation initiator family protein [Patescibacteria group bacterium]